MSSKESAAWATPRVLTIVNTYFLKAIFFLLLNFVGKRILKIMSKFY